MRSLFRGMSAHCLCGSMGPHREAQLVKIYLISLAVGVLAGVLYGLLNVRSPAPPIVALVGLLGILLGEQVSNRDVVKR